MNSKLIIGIAVAILVVGALLFLRPSEKKLTPQPPAIPTIEQLRESTIEVTESAFSPSVLTIKKGTKVTWVNKSGAVANISSGPHPVHNIYPPLNLENFNNGESLSLTFDKPGTYGYHDHLNSNRTGTITVE